MKKKHQQPEQKLVYCVGSSVKNHLLSLMPSDWEFIQECWADGLYLENFGLDDYDEFDDIITQWTPSEVKAEIQRLVTGYDEIEIEQELNRIESTGLCEERSWDLI